MELKLTPHEHVTVVEETPDLIAVEAVYQPGNKPPPRHFHPSQDEHFEVLSGELHTKVGGTERVVRAGETLDVPRRTVHQMWNGATTETRVRWETRPAGRTGEWFRALDALNRAGDGASPGLPTMAALLTEFDDVFRLAGAPMPLLKAVGVLGRGAAEKARAATR